MTNPAMLLPQAMTALRSLHAATADAGVPAQTLDLVHIRASQINGCAVCMDLHTREARHHGETDERLFAVGTWRDAPWFTDAERAALALTEAATRLSDRSDPVPDDVWNDAARHYDERQLAALVVEIAGINAWNRLNVSTRQVAGAWRG
jgi:AhpD family alkylhydroperoxidase